MRAAVDRKRVVALNRKQVNDLREERGWSWKDFAREAGVSLRSFDRLEAGISRKLVAKLAKALDVTVEKLYANATLDSPPPEVLRPVPGFDQRPAIAVLSFANVSGDPNQDYFADGITYNIISELASWRAFPVIGRGSTFAFKNRAIDIQSLGKQLGARYLVDGSAAKTTTRVQVTAQLIDATNGQCLVPERHERNVGDLFEIQRDIVEAIVGSIAPEVLKVECERVERRQSLNPTSYEYFMRGLAFHYRYTKEDNAEAQRFFRQAIDADSKNAQAYARLAHAMVYAVQHRCVRMLTTTSR